MKALFTILLLLHFYAGPAGEAKDDNVRYVLIEAPCKSGFPALPGHEKKVILTNIFKVAFDDPFSLVNAEPELISDFEAALEKTWPDSRNQIEDIMVYMLKTEKEAKELYKRKKNLFKMLDTGIIDMKIKER